jgi:RNA polymerase sigma factor (sigma-70 family)
MATVPRTPDAELLRRLRTRDRTAWEELYAEYQPRLRAFAYRLSGNPHDAEDLVQETFLRAVPRLDELDPEATEVAAYLFATLKNLFLKQVEKTKRQEPVAEVPEPQVQAPIEDDPERSLLLGRQLEEVRVANARLQPRQRLVLALRELEDRSYAEIGELVGMKENAVAQLIFRARESLRVELRLAQVDPERLPEECRRFLPLLAAHLDGQLKGARREETLAHLDGCERCQAALADMREASRRYRTLLPLPFGAEEARAATDEQLEATGFWRRPAGAARRARLLRRVGALVGATVVLVAGGAALGVALADDDGRTAATTTTTTEPTGGQPAQVALTTTADTGPATETTVPVTTAPPPPDALPPANTTDTTTTEQAETSGPPRTTTTTTPEPKPDPKPKPDPAPEPDPKPPVAPDTKAPVVTITSKPAAATASDTAQVAFRSNEAGAVFTCSLDGAAYAACVSPVALTALAPGQHTFSVRARDKAGNASAPVSVAWTYTPPDTTPPNVSITAAPPSSTTATSASFSFASSEAGVTFACSLDGAAFSPCVSPVTYTSLALGPHDFVVRPTDAAGNAGPTDDHQWTVVQPLPDLLVTAFGAFSITVRNQGSAPAGPSILTITLVGAFQVPSLQPGASITLRWSTCRRGTYTAVVDRQNVVAESDEKNNTATRTSTCTSAT